MIKLSNITKKYDEIVLNEISYTFEKNKIYVIKGVSGCGKTTLLNIIGGLEDNYEGDYIYNGVDVGKMSGRQRKNMRCSFGYIFQSSLLMANLTVMENLLYINNDKELITNYARQLNIEGLLSKYPEQLSGGERQRVAIIRILIRYPEVIIADEPTASLDGKNSKETAEIFARLRNENQIIIIATHEKYFDELADEIIHLDYGVIGEIEHNERKETKVTARHSHNETEAREYGGNSFKVIFPLIFRRNREKFRIRGLMSLILVIASIMICMAVQQNFYDVCVEYCKSKYPMETFSIADNLYKWQLSGQYDNVEKFDLYIVETESYVCYPLLSKEDSVLAYGGLIKYGTFPEADSDVLVSYEMAEKIKGKENVQSCIDEELSINGMKYTIKGVVADIKNDTSIEADVYSGDCYYRATDKIDVYIPYVTISQYGRLYEIGDYMVKVDGIYDDKNEYKDIKENVMGGHLSLWDSKLTDMLMMTENVNKIIFAAFVVAAFMATIFIKNDIDVDLFYRRRELGYLQIFGVSKGTIRIQLILERMAKNAVALCMAIIIFNLVAGIVRLTTGINIFITLGQTIVLMFTVLGYSFISVLLPIRKFINKSVLSLITE